MTKMWQQLLTRGLTSCCPSNLESREEQYKTQQLTFPLILTFLIHSYFFQFIKEVIYYLFPRSSISAGTHLGQAELIDEKGDSSGGHMLPAGLRGRPPN